MQAKRILVVGYGKLGSRVAQRLSNKHEVTAIKRSPIEPQDKINMCFADVTNSGSLKNVLNESLVGGVDYLIYCLSPSERSEKGYRDAYLIGLKNVLTNLPNSDALQHIIFVSSTSVYHQANGEMVDENSLCSPSAFSGKVLLEAEAYISDLTVASTSIRFSGIYGASRGRLIDQVKQALETGGVLKTAPGYTNRIHEDDCVGFICHLVNLLDEGQAIEAYYVASDSCPMSLAEVYRYIAEQLNHIETSYQDKNLNVSVSENSAHSRRAGSKRCVNKRMLDTGYSLSFNSYLEGYKQKTPRFK